jgi:lipid II:glycine glycyltransferase (peptidoglycan interpeptide bridge formation enzyme)
MIVREVLSEEKEEYNKVVSHPLQSWEWGEFKILTGAKVIRLGVFDTSSVTKKMVQGFQVDIHPVPGLPFKIIYFPRGPMPDEMNLNALIKLAKRENAAYIKMEPNVAHACREENISGFTDIKKFLADNNCVDGKPIFTKYTFVLDLAQGVDSILKNMKPKTRYNIRVAQKHEVKVVEDNSDKGLETFIKLFFETTNRQKFYGHTPDYYRKMKKALDGSGIYHLLLSSYQDQVLSADIFFTFNGTLYYPYGASTREHREVMSTYQLFWQAINLGIESKCTKFDMWGALGPNPDPKDPWYGFHRFKEGFGAQLCEFVGTYDLLINPPIYKMLSFADDWRWKWLRLRKNLPF